MSEFRPVFPAHAIERCAISYLFQPGLPEKAFRKISNTGAEGILRHGFTEQGNGTGFLFDVALGKLIEDRSMMPRTFVSQDAQTTVVVATNAITVVTQQYVRWAIFRGLAERLTSEIVASFNEVVSVNAVKLEYWDRFFWTGIWDTFQPFDLLVSDSGLVSPIVANAKREWHSHVGWFEPAVAARRLVNVNTDIIGMAPPGQVVRPSIGIYTMMQEQALTTDSQADFERIALGERFEVLHSDLKKTLSSLLSGKMARKIGLDSGSARATN